MTHPRRCHQSRIGGGLKGSRHVVDAGGRHDSVRDERMTTACARHVYTCVCVCVCVFVSYPGAPQPATHATTLQKRKQAHHSKRTQNDAQHSNEPTEHQAGDNCHGHCLSCTHARTHERTNARSHPTSDIHYQPTNEPCRWCVPASRAPLALDRCCSLGRPRQRRKPSGTRGRACRCWFR